MRVSGGGGGFCITDPGHDINGGQLLMPKPPEFIGDVDKLGVCIWRGRPGLQ